MFAERYDVAIPERTFFYPLLSQIDAVSAVQVFDVALVGIRDQLA